jgi:hypothetical protein
MVIAKKFRLGIQACKHILFVNTHVIFLVTCTHILMRKEVLSILHLFMDNINNKWVTLWPTMTKFNPPFEGF